MVLFVRLTWELSLKKDRQSEGFRFIALNALGRIFQEHQGQAVTQLFMGLPVYKFYQLELTADRMSRLCFWARTANLFRCW